MEVDQTPIDESASHARKKPMTVQYKGATFILLQAQCAFVMSFEFLPQG